jgi:hypothetical protein
MKYVRTFEQFINEKYNHMNEEEEVKKDDTSKEEPVKKPESEEDDEEEDSEEPVTKPEAVPSLILTNSPVSPTSLISMWWSSSITHNIRTTSVILRVQYRNRSYPP